MTPLQQEILQSASFSIIMAMVILPVMVRLSTRFGLVDKPNKRKVHAKNVPVVGGIVIFISIVFALLFSSCMSVLLKEHGALMAGFSLIFLTGVWDDKADVSPGLRLIIQFLCGIFLAAGGTRLTSLHGILGIYEIPIYGQYALTVIIIAGATNAFNLMDGIDGLAGGLALINLSLLALLAHALGKDELVVLLAAACGALVIFIKNNFHPARIFMGDGGSMMLGFMLCAIGLDLVESPVQGTPMSKDLVLLLVTLILVVPVFDSIRVYIGRILTGGSPFKADKTHLHHLFLVMGLDHRRTSFYIYALELLLILMGLLLGKLVSYPLAIIVVISIFLLACQLLDVNRKVDTWLQQIRNIEKTD